MTDTKIDRAQELGKACYDGIVELFEKFDNASDDKADDIGEEIDQLSYGVNRIEQYEIILAGGGPAVRVYGDLENDEPVSAELQYQDWGTQWTTLHGVDRGLLLRYAQRHYFGK